jgi:hypothetical protein
MHCSGNLQMFLRATNGQRFWPKAGQLATKKVENFDGDLRQRRAFL